MNCGMWFVPFQKDHVINIEQDDKNMILGYNDSEFRSNLWKKWACNGLISNNKIGLHGYGLGWVGL